PEKCDVWIEDSSIASTYIQLAAKSMGLESCWVQIRERFYENSVSAENRVAQILNIPENFRVESIIAIGYSNEKKSGHGKDSLLYDKVHYEKY
ncbi:MAG: NAD(P)H nitroreductase, partial [Desulfobacula sp.]|nr:NAD(P)H nitroreductase [Desulfobacula sp.]